MKFINKKIVGIIGLGAMGMPIAQNLLKKKYIVYGYDIKNKLKAKLNKYKSFYFSMSVKDLCFKTNKVLIIVENQYQCDSIIKTILNLRKKGLLNKKFLIICCSTVSASWIEKCEKLLFKNKIQLIDSPMSGGPSVAIKGNLSLMISGRKKTLLSAKKILKDISKKQFILGSKAGYGSKMKTVNQCLAGIHILAAAEAIILAKKQKLNPTKVLEVIKNSAGGSWMFNDRAPRMIKKSFNPPKSKINIFVKDMKIVNETLKKYKLSLPLSKAALINYKKAKQRKMGNLDDSSIVTFLNKKY